MPRNDSTKRRERAPRKRAAVAKKTTSARKPAAKKTAAKRDPNVEANKPERAGKLAERYVTPDLARLHGEHAKARKGAEGKQNPVRAASRANAEKRAEAPRGTHDAGPMPTLEAQTEVARAGLARAAKEGVPGTDEHGVRAVVMDDNGHARWVE